MPDFKFFANAYLQKGGDPKKGVKVGGIITTENKDIDGEKIIAMDWSYFDNGFGKIKYEHDIVKGPDAIIGYPLKRFKKGKATHFEGELIPFDPNLPEEKLTPQQRLAKSTYTLLQHIDEYNATNPAVPQKAGWSIEGYAYTHKSLKPGQVGARISNVVFTTEPRNQETFATIIKSLGGDSYGMTPDTQTGWTALRKESIDSSTKEEENISKNKGKGAKKMFRNKSDAYNNAIESGKSHEDALAAANAWETTQLAERQEDYLKAEKSLTAAKDRLQKSLTAANSVGDIEIEIETKPLKKSLAKSLQTDKDGNIDVQDFMENVSDTVMAVADAILPLVQKVDNIAKSLSALSEARIEEVDAADFLRKATAVNAEALNSTNKDLASLTYTLQKSLSGGLSTEKINTAGNGKTDIVDNDNMNDAEVQKIRKSQVTQVLDELHTQNKLSNTAVTVWEGNSHMSEATQKVFKSHAADILGLDKEKGIKIVL